MSKNVRIGRLISLSREQSGVTQKELAKKLGTSQSAVVRMEKGRQNFTMTMLAKIGSALGKDIFSLPDQTVSFKISGGHKLSGEITTNTAKNSAVALICASLLNKGITVLRSVPKIEEVYRMIEVLKSLGVKTSWQNNVDLAVQPPSRLNINTIDADAATKTAIGTLRK